MPDNERIKCLFDGAWPVILVFGRQRQKITQNSRPVWSA